MTATADRPATSPHGAPDTDQNDVLRAIDRLSVEFPTVSIGELTAVVDDCRSDLSGVPPTALPEMLERLARVRLTGAPGSQPPSRRTAQE